MSEDGLWISRIQELERQNVSTHPHFLIPSVNRIPSQLTPTLTLEKRWPRRSAVTGKLWEGGSTSITPEIREPIVDNSAINVQEQKKTSL